MHPACELAFALFGTMGVTSPAVACRLGIYCQHMERGKMAPKKEVVALAVRNMPVLKIYH